MVIEKKFVKDKMREYAIKEYLDKFLDRVWFSHVEIQKTPVGVNIIIYSSKPGLVVGRGGASIRFIQEALKNKFNLESPVVEVREVDNPDLDTQIMAERIGTSLIKFGVSRFKAIGHKSLERMLKAGAIGVEIIISGKIPSSRARTWKFYGGYLPKCGDIAINNVQKGYKMVKLKSGVIGITVKMLPAGIKMPDHIYPKEDISVVEEVKPVKKDVKKDEVKEDEIKKDEAKSNKDVKIKEEEKKGE